MTAGPQRCAGVELGGTKCIAVVAQGRDILAQAQWPTGKDAAATLNAVADWLIAAKAEHGFDALGIASFGPLCLDCHSADFGKILNTPKPGWAGVDVVRALSGQLGVPVCFDTDVAGAALAEGLWGASVGCGVHVYLTIGTGIGGGVVIGGKPLHGAVHPEIGHIRVRRAVGDAFAGSCPVHGDCLEGLASGPAIALRAGRPAETIAPTDPVWDNVAHELAELMQMLILTLSPHRIVLGGGVGYGQSHLLVRVRKAAAEALNAYLPGQTVADLERVIVPAGLGAEAGVFGALALAQSLPQELSEI
ncbi:ROK family protein [Novosphingobium sp. Chol11]|uniref:ROK family protein n=1 Tax=Novosphingobium sp. Chol11 TaxID=1385763 RepID=UPI0025E12207|nr:ROK family protein [Novosphingobium sp. Chol11]